jgi:hypothetical protein
LTKPWEVEHRFGLGRKKPGKGCESFAFMALAPRPRPIEWGTGKREKDETGIVREGGRRTRPAGRNQGTNTEPGRVDIARRLRGGKRQTDGQTKVCARPLPIAKPSHGPGELDARVGPGKPPGRSVNRGYRRNRSDGHWEVRLRSSESGTGEKRGEIRRTSRFDGGPSGFCRCSESCSSRVDVSK